MTGLKLAKHQSPISVTCDIYLCMIRGFETLVYYFGKCWLITWQAFFQGNGKFSSREGQKDTFCLKTPKKRF